jgi:predicted nucleic acid-binding Zn ribbon protein
MHSTCYNRVIVQALQTFATGVIAEMLRRQPASKERTTFAWSVAVGPALARATTVEVSDGVLIVRARDQRWAQEIYRNRATVLARLRDLLGADAIRDVSVLREV